MRTVRLFAALAPAVLLSACLQSTALVNVNADGSGTIEHQTIMTAEAIAQMRQLTGLFGNGSAKPIDPFSEADARDVASKMGEGVSLISSTPIKTAAGEGRANVYGFRDIRQIKFNQSPATPGNTTVRAGGVGVGGTDLGTVTFDLSRTETGNTVLTLHSPDGLTDAFTGRNGKPDSPTAADQLAMVRQMLAGIRIALKVQPAGRLVRTNSPYVEGNTVTLFDLDMDALLRNDSAFTRFQGVKTKAEMAEVLKDVPAFKITLERDVTIEFAR